MARKITILELPFKPFLVVLKTDFMKEYGLEGNPLKLLCAFSPITMDPNTRTPTRHTEVLLSRFRAHKNYKDSKG